MKNYYATIAPKSSLFLGRDRGNRVVRHTYHYIPASTIGGALNSRFYQMGWKNLTKHFRFGNFYSTLYGDDDDTRVWLPAPRNLYYCPACRRGYLVKSFAPESALIERICSQDGCQTMCRPEQGVVETDRVGDRFEIYPNGRAAASPTVNALTVGRTELHRTTASHVDGRLHQVELLRVRDVPFRGDVWVSDEAANVIRKGAIFRLSIGGLRSRGCGRVELHIGDEIKGASNNNALLLVETPLLTLPDDELEEISKIHAKIATPYAQVAVNERWATKPLRFGKGLVSFLHTISVGSTLAPIDGEDIILGEQMYFYNLAGSELTLYGFDLAACEEHNYSADYDLADLWTLGYGRLRFLFSNDDE